MDHSCYKCGQSIEDGKPFCLHCGAPQIRVTTPEASVEPIFDGRGAMAERDTAALLPTIPAGSLPVTLSRDVKPCALAAALAVMLTFLGLNPFVAALGTGLLAVIFVRRRDPVMAIRPATGARLGAISGLLAFGISAILETLAIAVLHKGAEVRSQMIEKIQQTAERYPGPQVEPFLDFVKSPSGFAFLMVGSVLFGLVAFIVLGSIGGALGAVFVRRQRRL
jgi:hypothetical protein